MSISRLEHVTSALRDVIASQHGGAGTHEPTPTEYFAVIVATLNTSVQSEHVSEMLEILVSVIPSTAKSVVRSQFRVLSTYLLKIVNACDDSHQRILRLSLTALGVLSCAQEHSDGAWGSVQGLQIANCLLAHIDHSLVKVKKATQDQLYNLLQAHKLSNFRSISSYVGDFSVEVLRGCTRSDYKRTLQVVTYLERVLALLPDTQVLQIFDTAVGLQRCAQPMLTAAVYRLFDGFFQSPSLFQSSPLLSEAQLLQCLHRVVDARPTTADMESIAYFCTASASGLVALHRASNGAALTLSPRVVAQLVECCDSEFTQIHCAASTAIKRIAMQCCASGASTQSSLASKQCLVAAVTPLIQLRYQHAWIYALDAVRFLFEQCRSSSAAPSVTAESLLKEPLVLMASVYDAVESGSVKIDAAVHTSLSDTLGTALRIVGVVPFLTHVPLAATSAASVVSGNDFDSGRLLGIDSSREWVLTILSDNLRLMPCSLADFGNTVLAVARRCSHCLKHTVTQSQQSQQTTAILRTRVMQLWSLFPEFCHNGATDVAETFPRMAPLLSAVLQDEAYPELAPVVVQGLTHLVRVTAATAKAPSSGAYRAVQDASATFVPVLLQHLEALNHSLAVNHTDKADHHSQHQQTVACVAAFCGVAPPGLVVSVAKKLLETLLVVAAQTGAATTQTDSDATSAAGWLSTMLAIVPHLPEAATALFYRTVKPLLSSSSSSSLTLQKRAYSVLDSLLRSHGPLLFRLCDPPMEILALVATGGSSGTINNSGNNRGPKSRSLSGCHVSTRSMRLRCVDTLLQAIDAQDKLTQQEQGGQGGPLMLGAAMDAVFEEVLICQKDANKKARDCAMAIMKRMIDSVPSEAMFARLAGVILAVANDSESTMAGTGKKATKRRPADDAMDTVSASGTTATAGTGAVLLKSSATVGLCLLLLTKRSDQNLDALMATTAEYLPNLCAALLSGDVYNDGDGYSDGDGFSRPDQTRAALSFLRVCAAVLPRAYLLPSLPAMVFGFTDALGDEKTKYLSRCRAIVRKLVHRLSNGNGESSDLDQLAAYLPDSDKPLLQYILKMNRRGKRKKKEQQLAEKEERIARMLGSDSDDDSDDEEQEHDAEQEHGYSRQREEDPRLAPQQNNQKQRPKAMRAAELLSSFPSTLEDLLDDHMQMMLPIASTAKRPSHSHSNSHSSTVDMEGEGGGEGDDGDDAREGFVVTVTDDGQLVVREKGSDGDSTGAIVSNAAGNTSTAAVAAAAGASSSNNNGGAGGDSKKRLREPGEEYRSKKAAGDVWKKGMLQPHAYIPLDPRLLAKKNKVDGVQAFGAVVKTGKQRIAAAPKGSVQGNRNQRRAAKEHKWAAKK